MSDRPPWTCRPCRPGDDVALSALFARVFQRQATPDEWRWKLDYHDQQPPNVWLAVDEGDRPVCQYAGIPRRVLLPEGERAVMVAVDAMTAPEARGRGALTAVVTRAHAAWRDAGIAFVLGLPNEQWRSRQRALGWQPLTRLRWRIRPLAPVRMLARRSPLPGLDRFGSADSIWNACWDAGSRAPDGVAFDSVDVSRREDAARRHAGTPASDERPSLIRDTPWVIRRYLDPPASPYRLLFARRGEHTIGYAAYRVRDVNGRRVGDIPEIVAPGADEVGWWLLREVTRRMKSDGAGMAIALAVPGSRDDRLLRRRGFLFSWGAFDVDTVVLDPALTIDALRNAGPWIVKGGDFDVI